VRMPAESVTHFSAWPQKLIICCGCLLCSVALLGVVDSSIMEPFADPELPCTWTKDAKHML
jgi:hypothetical protein